MKNYLIWILLMVVISAEASSLVTIAVRSDVTVDGDQAELSELADITGDDIGARKTLAGLKVESAPAPGETLIWDAQTIVKKLRSLGEKLGTPQLKIPNQVTIRSNKVTDPTPENLRQLILGALRRQLTDAGLSVSLTELNSNFEMDIPQGAYVIAAVPLTRPRGAANFELLVMQDGHVIGRYWTTGRVAYTARVAKTRRMVEARSHVGPEDITWVTQDVTFLYDEPITADEVGRAIAKTAIQSGTIVTRAMLEREMALRFGDEVEVISGNEDILISLKAIAQQNGNAGDTVRVRNPATSKYLTGTVVGKGVVRVNY